MLGHDREDLHTSVTVLLDRFERDVEGQTSDLKIELETCDAVGCTRYLEVHVAKVIFCAEDVGQENAFGYLTVCVLFSNKTGGDTCARCGDRDACIHQREATATDGSHRSRAVRAHYFRDYADGVRELVFGRKDGQERTLCERTVPDFAATSESKTTCFAHREGRKVVVKDEGLALSAACKPINVLSVTASAECRYDEGLGFAAVENCRTMNTWENASLAGYGAKIS